MVIEVDFKLGSFVFLKTDQEQKQRMVTRISVTLSGVYYTLNCGVEESPHYSAEITMDRNWNIT
jgi:hypothetical protein